MGLKSQLIYQARLAEFPRSALPRDPRAACRWLFQPGLHRHGSHKPEEGTARAWAGTDRSRASRRGAAEQVQEEEEEEGRAAGMLLSEHARLQACYSSRGRGAGGAVLPSLSVDPRGAAGGWREGEHSASVVRSKPPVISKCKVKT